MLEIDNIEKYLIVVYSKLKENIFGADIEHSKVNASFQVFYGGFLQNINFLFSK